VRARFSNPDGALLPGLFCRVRVPFTRPYDALLVPQTALAMNQQGRYLLVVNAENKVENHVIKVGATHGDMVVIRSGITEDDRVVISGLQKARPGSVVEPVIATAKQDSNIQTASGSEGRPQR
jgi:RND family efflux transporter MFP subunit